MPLHHTLAASGAALLAVLALAGCSDKAQEPAQAVQQAVEKVTGKNKIKMKGNTPLDAAAYSITSITSVMSGKFKDYQISDNTVRLIVKDGATCPAASAPSSTRPRRRITPTSSSSSMTAARPSPADQGAPCVKAKPCRCTAAPACCC